ncbi:MAG: DUF6475 domain-containing protein [Desulfobacteraceae bacterium]|nr:DUF6475 domain-containing protein [Desulfobacteraceae bacterium]
MTSLWNEEDKKRIGEAFLAICELHNKTFSQAFAAIYMRALESYPAHQVVAALEKSVMVSRFFPKPAELIELIEGPLEEKAYLAWTTFRDAVRYPGGYSSVMFCDGRISAIIEHFGGWINICDTWLEKDDPFRRAEFVKMYRALSREPEPERHIGRIEQNAPTSIPWTGRWVLIGKDGSYTNMLRIEGKDHKGTLDLPQPERKKLPPPAAAEEDNSPIIPLSSIMPQLMGAFKCVSAA